jgi:hypothetical protein
MAKKTKKKVKRSRVDDDVAWGRAPLPENLALEGAGEKAEQVSEVTHVSEAPCSIEVSRDAKGVARWSIKLYGDRGEMSDVLDHVLYLDGKLRRELRGG